MQLQQFWGLLHARMSPLRNAAACLAAKTPAAMQTVMTQVQCESVETLEWRHDGLLGQTMVSSTPVVVLLGLLDA